jgi:acyl-CoA hydrolase
MSDPDVAANGTIFGGEVIAMKADAGSARAASPGPRIVVSSYVGSVVE